MSQSSPTASGGAMTRLKNLVKNPSALNDVHPRNDAAFGEALNVFVGKLKPDQLSDESRAAYEALRAHAGDIPEAQLGTAGRRVYHTLRALQQVLNELDAIIELPDLPKVVKDYLERHVSNVRTEAGRYEKDPSIIFRSSAALLLSGCLGWLDWLAAKGEDKSFIPLRMPTNVRSTLVFYNWVQHPTGNWAQLGDIAVQRIVTPFPGQILYTISYFLDFFYGTGLYEEINIAAALSLVTFIIVMQEAYEARDRVTRWRGRRAMRLASSGDLRDKMQANAAALKLVQDWMQEIRSGHVLSPAEDDQFSRFQLELSELIKGLRAFADLIASPGTNKGIKEKLSTIIPTVVFGVIQAIASLDNDAGLALIAAQLEYTVYRQIKIAMSKDYTTERAWNFMGQSGGIVPATVALQSIPLFAGGHDLFNTSEAWLYSSTTILSVAQCTVVDKTGPGTLALVQGIGRLVNTYCCCLRRTDGGVVVDVEAFAVLEQRMRPIEEEELSAGRGAMSLDRAVHIWITAGIIEPAQENDSPIRAEDRFTEIENEPIPDPADQLKEMFAAFLADEDGSDDEPEPRLQPGGREYDFGETIVYVEEQGNLEDSVNQG